MDDGAFSLTEVCQLAGVTRRTVRYYIKQGLLPPAGRRGPGASYPCSVLSRLRLILRLKEQDVPLARIREQLDSLSDVEVRRLLENPEPDEPGTASEYIRRLLQRHGGRHAPPPAPPEPRTSPGDYRRSQWERIQVHTDVEIHVRRPLSRSQDQRVQRLVDSALRLFSEGTQ